LWDVHEYPPEIGESWVRRDFEAWVSAEGSGVFYVSGSPGTGKSCYMSSFAQTLYSPQSAPGGGANRLFACFFHEDARRKAGLVRPMAAMLLFQLLTQRLELIDRIHDYWRRMRDTRTTSTPMLLQTLKTLLRSPFDDEIILVMDGVDDWEPSPLPFVQQVIDLATAAHVPMKLVLSGDHDNSGLKFGSDWKYRHICLDIPIDEDDARLAFLDRIVDEVIVERPEYETFRETIIQRFQTLNLSYSESSVAARVLSRSRSKSLFASLLRDVRSVPGGLDHLYSHLLERSDPEFHNLTREALSWILFAERPLDDAELCAAIAAGALDEQPNLGYLEAAVAAFADACPTNIRRDLDLCTGASLFQPGSYYVRIHHSTLRKYLFGQKDGPWSWSAGQQNTAIAKRCLNFLSLFLSGKLEEVLGRTQGEQGVITRRAVAFARYAARFWPVHYHRQSTVDDALDWLVMRFLGCHDVARLWRDMYNVEAHSCDIPAGFTENGRELQVAAEFGLHGVVLKLVSEHGASYRAEDMDIAIDLASLRGYLDTVKFLCTVSGRHGSLALFNAALGRHSDVLDFLLSHGAAADINMRGLEDRTPLSIGCISGCEDIVRILLRPELKADLEAETPRGFAALATASVHGYGGIVDLLLERGANVHHANAAGESPISLAVKWGHDDVISRLEARGASLGHVDKTGHSLLHVAVMQGFSDLASRFSGEGACASTARTADGSTPLHLACLRGQRPAVCALLGHPACHRAGSSGASLGRSFVNVFSSGGRTPLHLAAEHGSVDIIRILLDAGADCHARAVPGGHTALQLAAKRGRLAVVKLLMESSGADCIPPGGKDAVLSLAAADGQFLVVRHLLRQQNSDTEETDQRGLTPLALAARGGHAAVVRLLLSAERALVERGDNNGWTPLHHAAAQGHTLVADILLENGARINAVTTRNPHPIYSGSAKAIQNTPVFTRAAARPSNKWPRERGRSGPDFCTALHLAASGHAATLARLLREKDVAVDARDENGFTALHVAALAGGPDEVALLLDHGADANAANADGDTPLHSAAWNGWCGNIRVLMARGADATRANADGRTPLHLSILSDSPDAVSLLFPHEGDRERRTLLGNTFLHYAVVVDSVPIAEMLVQWGAVPDTGDRRGRTPLADAVFDGKLEMATFLVEHGASVHQGDSKGRMPLHLACRNPEIVQMLLDKGADPMVRSRLRHTPLHFACAGRAVAAASLLLRAGADVNAQDEEGGTPLMAAVKGVSDGEDEEPGEESCAVLLRLLFEYRCDASLFDRDGRSALHFAALSGQAGVIALLCDQHSTDINGATRQDGFTPLHFAAARGSLSAVKALREHGADIAAEDRRGATALHLAMKPGRLDVVNYLLSVPGINPNHRDEKLCTPLIIAAALGQVALVDRLAALGAVDVPDILGFTPFLVAVARGDEIMVRLLLQHPARPNIRAATIDGRTALTLAAKGGFLSVAAALLETRGDDMRAILEQRWDVLGGLTALQTALEMHNVDIATELVRHGASIVTPTGTSPVFRAAMCNEALTRQMLDANPRLQPRADGFEELRMAVEADSAELWNRFEKKLDLADSLNVVDDDGWTLQMIVSQSKNQAFQRLLHSSSSPKAFTTEMKAPTAMMLRWPDFDDPCDDAGIAINGRYFRYNRKSLPRISQT